MIDGGADNDDLWGDAGDDVIIGGGQTATGGDIIHGGKGDDELTAGPNVGTTDTIVPSGAYSYVYGEEGNDIIWGENGVTAQYLWGGEDEDEIFGGNSTTEQ